MTLLEERCKEVNNFSERLLECNDDLNQLIKEIFPDLDPTLLEDEEATQYLEFNCKCSRERSMGHLRRWRFSNDGSRTHYPSSGKH